MSNEYYSTFILFWRIYAHKTDKSINVRPKQKTTENRLTTSVMNLIHCRRYSLLIPVCSNSLLTDELSRDEMGKNSSK